MSTDIYLCTNAPHAPADVVVRVSAPCIVPEPEPEPSVEAVGGGGRVTIARQVALPTFRSGHVLGSQQAMFAVVGHPHITADTVTARSVLKGSVAGGLPALACRVRGTVRAHTTGTLAAHPTAFGSAAGRSTATARARGTASTGPPSRRRSRLEEDDDLLLVLLDSPAGR